MKIATPFLTEVIMNIDGHVYEINEDGNIDLLNQEPFLYDEEYVRDRYEKYGWQTRAMSLLRLHFIRDFVAIEGKSILDVGYGNGDFLDVCSKQGMGAYGYDVSGYKLPKGVEEVDTIFDDHYDIVTFFDSLEHFPDIDVIEQLDCKYICISAPWCHYPKDANAEWFAKWKHLRPEEHYHHFTRIGLEAFMERMGFSMLDYNNIEDSIRGIGVVGRPNIITAFFTRGF